ncbi:MAG: TatD family hydrolase [Bacilli bacterium]|nr:TatD family hydrolase [Bacilli bacterium]
MFIDTHCHLSKDDYDDIDLVIKENRESGIDKIIVSCCDKSSIIEGLSLSSKYNDLYLTIGYHPSEASSIQKEDILNLEEVIKNTSKVVGIGEIGLDYHYGKEDIDQQKFLFREQLHLAEKLSLPVVIHSRDATMDTINILKEFPNVKGDIHCFSGSVETALTYISMGYKLGIGGVVTFKNSNLFKVIEAVGIDNIILETDSPYLTPEPYRGRKNSSKYIPYIAKRVAEILNMSVDEVALTTSNSAINLFDLK